MKIGFYGGSFDPFTNGHLHVIERSARLLDKVVVGIGVNSAKTRRFDQEPMRLAMENVFRREGLDNVSVLVYDNLTVDAAKDCGATILVRGIRNDMDYEYEENVAAINEEISGLDTIYIRAGKLGVLSSSMIMDLLRNGKNVDKYLPPEIQELIRAQESR